MTFAMLPAESEDAAHAVLRDSIERDRRLNWVGAGTQEDQQVVTSFPTLLTER